MLLPYSDDRPLVWACPGTKLFQSTGKTEQQHGSSIYSFMPQDNGEFQAIINVTAETSQERECPGNANYQSLLHSHI
jgi:hypothetical protein